jgi:AraC-like DNA-binding protein
MSDIIVDPSDERRILDFRLFGFCDVLVLGRYIYRETRSPLQLHDHGDFMEICYLSKGQQFYRIADKDYFLNGGDVLVTYPRERHGTGSFGASKGCLYWLILQPPTSQTEFLGTSHGNGKILYEHLLQIPSRQFKLKAGSQKNLEQIFTSFDNFDNFDKTEIPFCTNKSFQSFRSMGDANSLFIANVQNYLFRFLLDLVESACYPSRVSISDGIQYAIDRMRELDETFYTMKQLAKAAGLSESRFKHRFKEEVGTTPADYQLRCKIDHACQMLVQDNATILDTALSLGFSSSQYFATVFRRYMGIPPIEYCTIMKSSKHIN